MKFVDREGFISDDGYLFNDQAFQILNQVVQVINALSYTTITSNNTLNVNGLRAPSFTTAQITSLFTDAPIGTIWYNSDSKKLQFKSDSATLSTITSVP